MIDVLLGMLMAFFLLGVFFVIWSFTDTSSFKILEECFKYRTTPEKLRKAKEKAKRKLDNFLDEAVEEYNNNRKAYDEAKAREEEAQRRKWNSKYNSSYWEESPKFSQPSPSNMFEKHQKVLGIPIGQRLNKTILMNAYKKAAIKSHPDKGGSKEAFIAVQQAKDYLEKFI